MSFWRSKWFFWLKAIKTLLLVGSLHAEPMGVEEDSVLNPFSRFRSGMSGNAKHLFWDPDRSQVRSLSIDILLDSVERHYPEILGAEQDIAIAESDYLAAQGNFDLSWKTKIGGIPEGYYKNSTSDSVVEKPVPVAGLSFFAGYRLGRGNFPVYYGGSRTNDLGEVRAGAKIPLFRGRETDSARTELAQKKVGKDWAKANVAQQKIAIRYAAIQAYWDWVAAGHQLEVLFDLLELAKVRATQIDARVNLGDLPRIEKTENDRAILERKAQFAKAERAFQKASLLLSLYFRDANGKSQIPVPGLLPRDMPDLVTISQNEFQAHLKDTWRKRPEIIQLEIQKETHELKLDLEKNGLQPQVDLVVAASKDYGPGTPTLAPFQVEASVVLDIPLQTRKQRGKMGAIEGKLRQIEQKKILLRDKITTEIQNAWAEVETSRQTAKFAAEEADLAKQLEEMERERFSLGDGNLLFVNIREQKTSEVRIKWIRSMIQHKLAVAAYEAAVLDGAFEDGIRELLSPR